MEIKLACSTWITEDDEKVLNLLLNSDRWLTVEEIAEQTQLPPHKIKHTLNMTIQQMKMGQSRSHLRDFLES